MAVRNTIKSVFIDLSGTLHVDYTAIAGAAEALKRLRDTNLNIKFVTNTTKESRRFLHDRLVSLGFDISPDEIFTSLHAAKRLIQKENLKPMLVIDDAAWEDFEEYKDINEADYNAVVIGLAPKQFHYDVLNKAFRLLLTGARLVAIHEGRYYKQTDGLSLGPGPFVRGLQYASNVTPVVVGKPNQNFFNSALDGVEPKDAVMIGDDVLDDVHGAQQAGIRGILVQTGKYRQGDEEKIEPRPAHVCTSFKEAVDVILNELC